MQGFLLQGDTGLSILLLILLSAPDTLELTFDKALERAYLNAPEVRLAGVEIEQQELQRQKVLSEFFPQITGQASFMRMDEAPSLEFELAPGYPFELTLGDEKFETVQGKVQLPLWTFGRRLHGYALAEEAVELARLDSLEIRRQLRFQVTELSLNIIALEDAELLTQAAFENASSHRRTIEKKYGEGLVSHYELLEAKTKEAELLPELTDTRQQKITLGYRMAILLNLGADTTLALIPAWKLPDTSSGLAPIAEITAQRPTWKQIELGYKMLDRQIKIKQRESLPVLVAGADYSMQRSPLTDGAWDGGWSYNIAAQFPFASGFKNYAEVKRLEKEKQKLAIQQDALKAQIRF